MTRSAMEESRRIKAYHVKLESIKLDDQAQKPKLFLSSLITLQIFILQFLQPILKCVSSKFIVQTAIIWTIRNVCFEN